VAPRNIANSILLSNKSKFSITYDVPYNPAERITYTANSSVISRVEQLRFRPESAV